MDPFLYVYAVGGIVFGVGLFYGFRQGYLGFSGGSLRNLLILLGGLAFFMGLQGYMQYAPMAVAKPGLKPRASAPALGHSLTYTVMILYFVSILVIGTFFGKNQKTTKDFFFGGQRFSWWLIAFSLVATTIGSSSFVKYSKIAYKYGLASSQTYLNDWFWMPLFMFGWLPILYFSRVTSIPEYFERRFNATARKVVTWMLLLYLVGYVGVNLFTMGKALHYLLGWPVFVAAAVVACISAIYVTFGGQTSVIMTDLFQGVMLLACGLAIVWLGAEYLGGFKQLWQNLPRSHRMAFPNFNAVSSYSTVGVFWQDAMANSAMFYFLNQGMLMRFMAARSVNDSRRSVVAMLLILMPIAAVVVASGGWVGKALVYSGVLPDMEPAKAFYVASRFLSSPAVFGLVMAALTAALMSTVDTLITAIAAIVVNDVYKPARPDASEEDQLKVARISSVSIAVLGVLLVPLFMMFKSIYSAHGAFTAAITPPLVVALLFGVFWRRYTSTAAIWTMLGGIGLVTLSIFFPVIIKPFAHGVPMVKVEPGLLSGVKQYKFMRACFGLGVSVVIGIVVTYLTTTPSLDKIKGLVWGTIPDAIAHYKGSAGQESESDWIQGGIQQESEDEFHSTGLTLVQLSPSMASQLSLKEGDFLYISDTRRWLGGLRSGHGIVSSVTLDTKEAIVQAGPSLYEAIVAEGREKEPIRLRRLYENE
jgi:SSS family solute:Na+ symporter